MLLSEAKKILKENGFILEVSKEEYDAAMEAKKNYKSTVRTQSWHDPTMKKLIKRRDKEMDQFPIYSDKIKNMRVPGKRPGTTRFPTSSEREELYKTHKEKRKEIEQKYEQLQDKLLDRLEQKYLKILDDEQKSIREYEAKCTDWCIVNWYSAPGSKYDPKIVQKGYKTKEEAEKDLAKFNEWAWTEINYTDIEAQCYVVYPTEIVEEAGIAYKEKKVPEGNPPKFKANPYYTSNYWGD